MNNFHYSEPLSFRMDKGHCYSQEYTLYYSRLYLNVLTILWDTELLWSLCEPSFLWLETTWNAKDDPVSICIQSSSIPTVFP